MALWNSYREYLKQIWSDANLGPESFPEDMSPQDIVGMLQNEVPNLRGPRQDFVIEQLGRINAAINDRDDGTGRPTVPGLDDRIPSHHHNLLRTHRIASEKELGIRNPGASLRDIRFEADYTKMPVREVGVGDLPPLEDPDAWRRQMRDIEARAEEAVRARTRKIGDPYEFDPFNMGLGTLHWSEREPLLREIEEHIGMRQLLNAGFGPEMFSEGAGMMKLSPELIARADEDPRVAYLARQAVQFRPDRVGMESIAEQYSLSGRVGRLDAVENDAFQRFLESPGKYAVLDVESAGLNPRHGSWQWFARVVDPEAGVVGDHNIYFKNKTMQSLGMVGSRTLEDVAAGEQAVDFTAENILPWLRHIQDVDYVVGHNLSFDYGQFFHSITHLSAYADETSEFGQVARKVLGKFYDPQTMEIKNFIDTRELALRAIPDIEVSPELLTGGTKFSLQNILLQTDLLDRVRNAEGPEALEDWLTRGATHAADVDVPIEHALFESFVEHARTGRGLNFSPLTDPVWTPTIAKSQALGPLINLTDFQHQIHEELVEPLLRASIGTPHPALVFRGEGLHANLSTPEDILEFVQEAVANGMTRHEALKAAGISDAVQSINLNPMMQMIHHSRIYEPPAVPGPLIPEGLGIADTVGGAAKNIFQKLHETFISPPPPINPGIYDLAHEAASWREFSERFIGQDGRIMRMRGELPTAAEWAAQQSRWASKGIPFAGSSWVERHIMATLGTTSAGSSEGERVARSVYGEVIAPMGHWVASTEAGVIHESRVVKLPEWMLHAAEREGVFDTPEGVRRTAFDAADRAQLYSLSPFRHRGGPEVGLMFHFGEGEQGSRERRALFDFLKRHAGTKGFESISEEKGTLAALESALIHQDSQRYGVQVGTLGGVGSRDVDQGAAARVYRMLEDLLGTTRDDINSVHVASTSRLPAGGFRDLGGVPQVVKTTGAVLRPDLMDDAEHMAFAVQAQSATRLAERARELAETSHFLNFAKRNIRGSDVDSALGVVKAVGAVKRRAPLIALAAATAGAGYYAHKRHRDNRLYNATLDFQPLEDEGWYDQYDASMRNRHRPMISRQSRGPQPLETAGITHVLDRRKTNHTNMGGADKYGYLFNTGGV